MGLINYQAFFCTVHTLSCALLSMSLNNIKKLRKNLEKSEDRTGGRHWARSKSAFYCAMFANLNRPRLAPYTWDDFLLIEEAKICCNTSHFFEDCPGQGVNLGSCGFSFIFSLNSSALDQSATAPLLVLLSTRVVPKRSSEPKMLNCSASVQLCH